MYLMGSSRGFCICSSSCHLCIILLLLRRLGGMATPEHILYLFFIVSIVYYILVVKTIEWYFHARTHSCCKVALSITVGTDYVRSFTVLPLGIGLASMSSTPAFLVVDCSLRLASALTYEGIYPGVRLMR
jgi:hypothetical protein